MGLVVTGSAELKHDSLTVIPLGGQGELGQLLWLFIYAGEILLVDAGAAYPSEDLPGVDLLLPNTNFLEANQDRILALLLTNGHEEHCGATSYLLHHLRIPRIMAPKLVCSLLSQLGMDSVQTPDGTVAKVPVDCVDMRQPYQIGPFEVEWIHVNNSIADACALKIGTPAGTVLYTSSFKLDQTPVDKRFLDIARLAQIGDSGVLLLISDSANAEQVGYSPSEFAVVPALEKQIGGASGRVIAIVPGTNTHRLQILFDIAARTNRKVILLGDTILNVAIAAAITGNLSYDRKSEATVDDLSKLADEQVLIITTGIEADPISALDDFAYGRLKDITPKQGDTVIFSADIVAGRARHMAMILDQLLGLGVKTIYGSRQGVHVSKHGSCEELKLMISLIRPRYFLPAMGEFRHIMHHKDLAIDWGMPEDSIFPLHNGDILTIDNGVGWILDQVESQSVLFNREQGERVTTFSVNERRSLSLEGIVTVGLIINPEGEILSGPSIEVGASGFLRSQEWLGVHDDLVIAIRETVARLADSIRDPEAEVQFEVGAVRAAVREVTAKTLRSRLTAKPTVQVIVHQYRNGQK